MIWTGTLHPIMFRLMGFCSLRFLTRATIVRMTGRGTMRLNPGAGHCRTRKRQVLGTGTRQILRHSLVRMPQGDMKRIRNLGKMDGRVGPFQWDGAMAGRFRGYPTFQTFTLSSDGTFRIDKFDHWAERNTLGMVWVDGSLLVNPWPW